MFRSVWVPFSLALLAPAVVSAQAPATPQPIAPGGTTPASTAPPTDGGSAAPALPGASTTAAPESVDAALGPKDSPAVDDPMLKPVPPPERVLKDWREALELVRTRSPDYIRAHQQVEVARGRSRMTLARALPELTGNADVRYPLLTEETEFTVPSLLERWNVGGTLRVPLLSSRNWYDHATSRDSIRQADLTREDVERQIIGGLAEAMVLVITNERLSEVTRVNLAAALSTVDLNERRERLGAGSAVDVLRAKQEAARSRAQVIEADERLRTARETLGEALGFTEPFGLTPDLKMDQLRQDARNTCSQGTNPDDRADVRAAAAGAAIAERNVKSVAYSHVPTIDFLSTVNHTSVDTVFSPQTTWTISAALTWHLYDGGFRYGERHTNEALAEQSRQDSIAAGRNAQLEVTQSTRGVSVARASLEVALESHAIAKENARLARAKFMSGSGTAFDMVDTQSTARQADIDVTVKEFQLLRAEIIAFLALASCEL